MRPREPYVPSKEVNPGITRVVQLLNEHGFQTCDSGDGETHAYQCDRDTGYVTVLTTSRKLVRETERLQRLLLKFGLSVTPVGHNGVGIQASYDPSDGSALIDVTDIHDRMLLEQRS